MGEAEPDGKMVDFMPFKIYRYALEDGAVFESAAEGATYKISGGGTAYCVSRSTLMAIFAFGKSWEFSFAANVSGSDNLGDTFAAIYGPGTQTLDLALAPGYDTGYLPHGHSLRSRLTYSNISTPFPNAGEFSIDANFEIYRVFDPTWPKMDPSSTGYIDLYDSRPVYIEYVPYTDAFYIYPRATFTMVVWTDVFLDYVTIMGSNNTTGSSFYGPWDVFDLKGDIGGLWTSTAVSGGDEDLDLRWTWSALISFSLTRTASFVYNPLPPP